MIDIVFLVSSTIPFDRKAKIHVSLSNIGYGREDILCGRNLSPGRFSIVTEYGTADYGESKQFSINDFKNMPNACKHCLKQLEKRLK